MPYGQRTEMKLAERGALLGNKIWVREIRKLTDTHHQISVVSTDFKSDLRVISCHMFSRWSQENFFKYMRNHYNIQGLIDYSTEPVDETEKVVNPAHRKIESKIKSKVGKLNRKKVEFYSAKPVLVVRNSFQLREIDSDRDIAAMRICYVMKGYLSPFMRDPRIKFENLTRDNWAEANLNKLLAERCECVNFPELNTAALH